MSLQLGAIDSTVRALKGVVLPVETDNIKAESSISPEVQLGLINAMAAQVDATGKAMACVLSRLSGDTLAGMLAGKPNKRSLVELLEDIYGQIGIVSRLIELILMAYGSENSGLDELGRLVIEDFCRYAIENIDKPKGVRQ